MEALTESRLRELEGMYDKATRPYGRPTHCANRRVEDRQRTVVWSEDEKGLDIATFPAPNGMDTSTCYINLDQAFPALAAAAREGIKAEKYRAALKAAQGAMGMHGPCRNNDCAECGRAWKQINEALKG